MPDVMEQLRTKSTDNYRRIVEQIAKGTEQPSEDDVQSVLTLAGRSVEQLSADVSTLRSRKLSFQELVDAKKRLNAAEEIKKRFILLRYERNQIAVELTRRIAALDRQIVPLEQEYVSETTQASRDDKIARDDLRRTAPSDLDQRIAAARLERTRLIDQKNLLSEWIENGRSYNPVNGCYYHHKNQEELQREKAECEETIELKGGHGDQDMPLVINAHKELPKIEALLREYSDKRAELSHVESEIARVNELIEQLEHGYLDWRNVKLSYSENQPTPCPSSEADIYARWDREMGDADRLIEVRL